MPDVFVNYRTGDEESAATMIARELARRFGGERIFFASNSIEPGHRFPVELVRAVEDCEALLAVIGPELFRHLLVPPVSARSETTVGGPLGRGDRQRGGTFDREEEVGVSDRLLLLLAALDLKPDMDEYTVFVHRVVRSLEAAGLDEAAEEIRRTLLPTPGEGGGGGGGEWPEGGPSGEGDTTGPWSPRFPAPEGSPLSDAAAAPDDGAGERNQDWQEMNEDDGMEPPHFRDTSHIPHRPAAPRARDEDAEAGS